MSSATPQISLDSIFEGLNWLDLGWDEFYRQSDRVGLHHQAAFSILEKGWRIAISRPPSSSDEERTHDGGPWLFNPGHARAFAVDESDRRAAAGEPFVLRFRVPRETRNEIVG